MKVLGEIGMAIVAEEIKRRKVGNNGDDGATDHKVDWEAVCNGSPEIAYKLAKFCCEEMIGAYWELTEDQFIVSTDGSTPFTMLNRRPGCGLYTSDGGWQTPGQDGSVDNDKRMHIPFEEYSKYSLEDVLAEITARATTIADDTVLFRHGALHRYNKGRLIPLKKPTLEGGDELRTIPHFYGQLKWTDMDNAVFENFHYVLFTVESTTYLLHVVSSKWFGFEMLRAFVPECSDIGDDIYEGGKVWTEYDEHGSSSGVDPVIRDGRGNIVLGKWVQCDVILDPYLVYDKPVQD